MPIDFILAILLVLATIKGYQRGLIVGVFSLLAIIIGLAAAMKLSTVAAKYIGTTVNIAVEWMPFISFTLVFIVVVWLVRLGANAIQKTVEIALLGWVNKLGGVVMYAAIYIIVFSILLFYAEQMQLLKPDTIKQSVSYTYIQPWGPKVVNGFASIIPLFKNMFGQLENFFGNLASGLSTS